MIKRIRAIIEMLYNEPKVSFKMIWRYFDNNYICKTVFFSDEALFLEIDKGKSIIRMGDGDMGIMHKKDIFHQVYEAELAKLLRSIVSEYSKESPYILLIPKFLNISNRELRQRGNLICWLPFKIEYMENFSRNIPYGDAHIFYNLATTKKLFLDVLKDKKVLVVSNKEVITKCKLQGNTNFVYYETPVSGTSKVIANIEKDIDTVLAGDMETKIVFSCGCSSRILAQRFSKKGFQCFDVGTGINCYLEDEDYSHVV